MVILCDVAIDRDSTAIRGTKEDLKSIDKISKHTYMIMIMDK